MYKYLHDVCVCVCGEECEGKAHAKRGARGGQRERDVQLVKLRHLADVDRNGAAYLQLHQIPASRVCEQRVQREECEDKAAARWERALRVLHGEVDSQCVARGIVRIKAPHPRALHARRPLLAVLEEVGRLRAVCRLCKRRHHHDCEKRREGVEEERTTHRFPSACWSWRPARDSEEVGAPATAS